jgi:zinc ribbon protein
MFCTQCGTKNIAKARYCYECGANLSQQVETPPTLSQQVKAPSTEETHSIEPPQKPSPVQETHQALGPQPNFIEKHWLGDYSLGYSLFYNGLLIGFIFSVVGMVVGATEILVLIYGLLTIHLFVGIWVIVGIWRSANKHKQRGGKAIWASLAKALMVLWTVSLVVWGMFYIMAGVAFFSDL